MSKPVAKQGDHVVGVDTHIILVPSPGGPVPTPMPLPFDGVLSEGLAEKVQIDNCPVAVKGSKAKNTPPHIPPGGPFQSPPDNTGEIMQGSSTVMVEDKPVARMGDPANTCNDPAPAPVGTVIASSTVMVGD